MRGPDAPGRSHDAGEPRFHELIAVADPRHRGAAVVAARHLARAGVPLTVVEVGSDPAADRVGAQVVDGVGGRHGALLVIDALGGGPPGGPLFDADAEHVLTRVPEPVLVLGPRAEAAERAPVLLVPVDGRGAGDGMLAAVERWSRTFTTTTTTVIGLTAPSTWDAGPSEPAHDLARLAVAGLTRRGVTATFERVVTTEAATALAEAAAAVTGAVLVVAAPRWPATSTHWYATSRRLIRRARRPVLVVPDDPS